MLRQANFLDVRLLHTALRHYFLRNDLQEILQPLSNATVLMKCLDHALFEKVPVLGEPTPEDAPQILPR